MGFLLLNKSTIYIVFISRDSMTYFEPNIFISYIGVNCYDTSFKILFKWNKN